MPRVKTYIVYTLSGCLDKHTHEAFCASHIIAVEIELIKIGIARFYHVHAHLIYNVS
jgi:hypothetical protein